MSTHNFVNVMPIHHTSCISISENERVNGTKYTFESNFLSLFELFFESKGDSSFRGKGRCERFTSENVMHREMRMGRRNIKWVENLSGKKGALPPTHISEAILLFSSSLWWRDGEKKQINREKRAEVFRPHASLSSRHVCSLCVFFQLSLRGREREIFH